MYDARVSWAAVWLTAFGMIFMVEGSYVTAKTKDIIKNYDSIL